MEIIITNRKGESFTILYDEQDFETVNSYKWSVEKSGNTYYASMARRGAKTIKLHRLIMKVISPDVLIDHINHNGLDNRRANLRICTKEQNCRHRTAAKNSTSIFLGVYFRKAINKWVAQIKVDKKQKVLGNFINEIDAAKAYDVAAINFYGEFANLNFK